MILSSLLRLFPIIFFVAGVCGTVLHAVAVFRLRRLRGKSITPSTSLEPATLWRAIKPGVPRLHERLADLVRASTSEDQILIGLDAESPDLALCQSLTAAYPDRDITIVECQPGQAANPKISKFIQMEPLAKHPRWILTDSEAEIDVYFLGAFRSEWLQSGTAALTAGYRFTEAKGFFQILDAAPALITLWPGLMLTPTINFTLGACTGLMKQDLHDVGGWKTFGNLLAEDHALGMALHQRGRTIGLSSQVLPLQSDPTNFSAYLRHQHRVAVTYRVANPAGTLGLPILHVTPLWLALTIDHPTICWAAATALLIRFGLTVWTAKLLWWELPGLVVPFICSPFVETACWIKAWFARRVWWAGKWRRINRRGEFLS